MIRYQEGHRLKSHDTSRSVFAVPLTKTASPSPNLPSSHLRGEGLSTCLSACLHACSEPFVLNSLCLYLLNVMCWNNVMITGEIG